MKLKKIAALLAVAGMSAPAFATNGMNMEGYGPVATGMGGASFAYDNGTAGMINNPATLGFMKSGTSRLDVAIGGLHPSVESNGSKSDGDAYFMPAIGYVRKSGNLTYGVGMMAQGGMGTEYSTSSAFGALTGMDLTGPAPYAVTDPGLKNKSEVGVGRLMFPVAYQASDNFTVGGSIDYVWAGMDIRWLMDGAHFASMMPGATNTFGSVSSTSSLLVPFQAAIGGGAFTSVDYGYFNFDTDSTFRQKATGDGWAGNLGFTFKASPQLTVGGVYHAKTSLSDMKTGASDAQLVFGVRGGGLGTVALPLTGQIVVKNFQWPETYGLGIAYQANDQWLVVADYKRINWVGVMKNFNMSFIADGNAANGTFAGTSMDLTFYQNWKNQNVFMIGASYKMNNALTLRFGVNLADNPIPDSTVTPLFPAIVKNHLTGGFGYAFDKTSSLDFSLVYAPKVTVTNNWSVGGTAGGQDQKISHSQTNWQLMYSHRF